MAFYLVYFRPFSYVLQFLFIAIHVDAVHLGIMNFKKIKLRSGEPFTLASFQFHFLPSLL